MCPVQTERRCADRHYQAVHVGPVAAPGRDHRRFVRACLVLTDATTTSTAAVEAAQKIPPTAGLLVSTREQITARRGRNVAIVAVARKLLTLV
jgi:hypothetical protein